MAEPGRGFLGHLYRSLLRFYPPSFRERHGWEMERVFAEGAEDARRSGVFAWLRYLTGGLADPVRSGLAERVEESRNERDRSRAFRGNVHRYERRGGGMESWIGDAKYAFRALLKNPGFAIVAVLTIGLGIGANTAIFSVVQSVLLDPLPYDDPDELVLLWGEMRTRGVTHFPSSPPDLRDYREQADMLESLEGVFTFPIAMTGDGDPVQVNAGGVTPGFLQMLGVSPIVGRGFVDEDGTPNDPNLLPGQPGSLPGTVILSHALWQQRYGSDPNVIGTTMQLGGGPGEIVGVMPRGFELLLPAAAALDDPIDVWLAARIDFDNAPRNNAFLRPVGRLRDGATPAQLQAQVDRTAASLAADDDTKLSAGYAMRVEGLKSDLTTDVSQVLFALFGAVAFVLLIACANVSNLLLVRASGRDKELAVRAAMGGSRGRLIRQMLIEASILALLGAALGIAVAAGGIRVLLALQPGDLPRFDSVGIDVAVLAFTLLAAAAAAVVFGLMPALQASSFQLADALRDRSPGRGGTSAKYWRNGVIVGEVALSMVLLIGAGLMVRSFAALTQVEPGYDPVGVLTFDAAIPFAQYPTASDRTNFKLQLAERLEAIPGVQRAGAVFPLPLAGNLVNGRYGPEEALTDPEAFGQAAYRFVMPGYFEAMGTRVLAGRTFTLADMVDSAAVVVIDEGVAESLWPGESAIGKRFLVRATSPEPEWVEVLGVVEHQRAESLATDGMEAVYFTDRYTGAFASTWVIRAGVDPRSLIALVRSELSALDPNIPLADIRLMDSYMDEAMAPTKFALTLIGSFGLLALVLAVIGLYGVLSYVVKQRTSEIGIRMAFGAERRGILKLIVGHGLVLAGAGILLGLVIAFALTRVMATLLVDVTPTDPLTFLAISGIFVLVATVASWIPARRATHVDPVTALREE